MKPKKPKRRTKAEIARERIVRKYSDFFNDTQPPWPTIQETILAALRAYERELRKRKK